MAYVFVSHAAEDLDVAVRVWEWLRASGHAVFLARDLEEGIRVGDALRDRLYEEVNRADALVCLVSRAFADSPWCAAEVALAGWSGVRVLPVRVEEGASHELVPADTVYADLTADAGRAQGELVEAVRRLGAAGRGSWSAGRSPFPGLRAFDAGLARVFFGRAAETRRLAERLRAPAVSGSSGRSELVAVVGPSGCGKSSLIGAGLVPLLAADRDWLILPSVVPGVDPVGALARQIAAAGRERGLGWSTEQATVALTGPDGLAGLAAELLAPAAPARWVLVVVDQAEELIIRVAEAGRRQFAAILGDALAGPVRVVATLRSEYLDPLLRLAADTGLHVGAFPLAPLARDMLRTVVTGPAAQAGIVVDDELVARLVDDTGGGEALPLLAFVLDRLAVGVRRGGVLSPVRYDEIGAVQGALAAQADAALAAACTATGRSRNAVLAGLLRLVTIDDAGQVTRRRVNLASLPEAVRTELNEFVSRRLLVVDTDDGDPVVTVAHEKVLTAWPPLADAIEHVGDDLRLRRTVEDAATDWDSSGRPPDHLWEAGRAASAERILDTSDMSPVAITFLATGRRHGRRRRLRGTAVLGFLLLLVSTGALLAFTQWRSVIAERETTGRARLEGIADSLVARADALRETDPRLSLRLGIAADRIFSTPRTRSGLLETLTTGRLRTSLPVGNDMVNSVAFSPDGAILAAGMGRRTGGASEGRISLWDVGDPTTPRHIANLQTGIVTSVVFSPHIPGTSPPDAPGLPGTILATATDEGIVTLWDLTDRDTPIPIGKPLRAGTRSGASLAFRPDGVILVAGAVQALADEGVDVYRRRIHREGTIALWDLTDPDMPRPIGKPLQTGAVDSVAFSPDGATLASGNSYEGTVSLWDVTKRGTIRQIGEPLKTITGPLAFSPEGTTLAGNATAFGVYGGALAFWNLADRGNPQRIGDPLTLGSITSVAFSPDGAALAEGRDLSGISDNKSAVTLWDITDHRTPRKIGQSLEVNSSVNSVAFSPDGITLASGSGALTPDRSGGNYEGAIILWDVTNPAVLRADPLAAACRRVGQGLSKDEWVHYIPSLPYRGTCVA
jgi:WD40 repeat protein